MNRPAPPPEPHTVHEVVPSEDHARLALQQAAPLMAPIVSWLLRSGVPYPVFADRLKSVFVDAARSELEHAGIRPTHSAISVLSGVHRKDVRSLEDAPRSVEDSASGSVPLASQVFTRWVTHPGYRGRDGQPRRLPRSGSGASFDTLARELSSDVHPRTVLDELIRLGLVGLEGDEVVLRRTSFVPTRRLEELTALFAANAADHLAAAVHNLTRDGARYLEQSVFANGLSTDSAERLHRIARDAWAVAFERMVDEAQRSVDADADAGVDGRVRFGVYFYSEPGPAPAAPPTAEPEAASRRPKGTRNRTVR